LEGVFLSNVSWFVTLIIGQQSDSVEITSDLIFGGRCVILPFGSVVVGGVDDGKYEK